MCTNIQTYVQTFTYLYNIKIKTYIRNWATIWMRKAPTITEHCTKGKGQNWKHKLLKPWWSIVRRCHWYQSRISFLTFCRLVAIVLRFRIYLWYFNFGNLILEARHRQISGVWQQHFKNRFLRWIGRHVVFIIVQYKITLSIYAVSVNGFKAPTHKNDSDSTT